MPPLLAAYLDLCLAQQLAETALDVVNRRYATDPERLRAAARALAIGPLDLARSVAYSGDRYRYALAVGGSRRPSAWPSSP